VRRLARRLNCDLIRRVSTSTDLLGFRYRTESTSRTIKDPGILEDSRSGDTSCATARSITVRAVQQEGPRGGGPKGSSAQGNDQPDLLQVGSLREVVDSEAWLASADTHPTAGRTCRAPLARLLLRRGRPHNELFYGMSRSAAGHQQAAGVLKHLLRETAKLRSLGDRRSLRAIADGVDPASGSGTCPRARHFDVGGVCCHDVSRSSSRPLRLFVATSDPPGRSTGRHGFG